MKKIFLSFLSFLILLSCNDRISSLKVASFNVQFFNDTKSSKSEVMKVVSTIITKFDIIAFQEIQGKYTIQRLGKLVSGSHNHIVSPKLGYSKVYKERYAFFYDKTKFKHIIHYVYPDKKDEFSREPFIGVFQVINTDKIFIFIDIHTPPKFATREIKKLPEVIEYASKKFKNNGVILLGDFNADCAYYAEKNYRETFPPQKYIWAIDNDMGTSIVSECTLDRIVLTNNLSISQVGVYDFKLKHGLSLKQALKVSDHFPIWIELKL